MSNTSRPIPVGGEDDRAEGIYIQVLAFVESLMAEEGASAEEVRAAMLWVMKKMEGRG